MIDLEKLIDGMCMTYRHDFGLVRDENDRMALSGMTESHRNALRLSMRQIYEHNIKPLLETQRQTSVNQDSRWLPIDTCNVYTCIVFYDGEVGQAYKNMRGKWYWQNLDNEYGQVIDPTHWRPLPPAPKEAIKCS